MSMSVSTGATQSYPQPPLAGRATALASPVDAPDLMSELMSPQSGTSSASDQSGSTATMTPPQFSTSNLNMLLALQDQSSNGNGSTTDNSGQPADAVSPVDAPAPSVATLDQSSDSSGSTTDSSGQPADAMSPVEAPAPSIVTLGDLLTTTLSKLG